MKKLIVFLLSLGFVVNVYSGSIYHTLIDAEQLDNSPTAISGDADIQNSEKVAFFVTYDETQVGNAISAAVTCYISYDGTNFLQASFYDYAGGATLQTSETISADGSYYFWFNKDLAVPYVRVTVTATGTDVDDILVTSVNMFTQQ
jgi:hypothetical protein